MLIVMEHSSELWSITIFNLKVAISKSRNGEWGMGNGERGISKLGNLENRESLKRGISKTGNL